MNKIIIGSTAAYKYNLSRRSPSDLDVWVLESIPAGKGLDQKVIPKGVFDLVEVDSEGFATPDSLFTIKCSHLGWSNPMWNKHYLDVLFMKQKGCVIKEDLYAKLLDYWKEQLSDKSFLSLKQNKDDFFTDNVPYKYDHDLLHEVAAYPNKPIYSKCLIENEDVLIDKEKFFNMDFEDRILMFQEEIHVILLERWIIPQGVSCFKAYSWALEKTITTLTKGWATNFIIRNIDRFRKPNINIINNLNKFLEEN